MEISLNPNDYADIDYKIIKKWSEEFNIDLWSFHLPFFPFSEIDISNANICNATIRYYEDLIKNASEVGIKRFIVHPSGEPISDEERPDRLKCAKESLAVLAEIARKNNSVIAVEDLPRSCLGKNSDEIAELIGVHKNLKVCFDTNHLLNENPVDFIHKLGNRIITTHISDYDFINERHWLPGEGKLDWEAILNAFKDIGYNGVWLYEIGFSCPDTIIRNRDLTCDDFAKNAKELFENKPITIFSTHKDTFEMR
ncbi:MAG: sugar phosphate isomerase/epimerase [Clostridia bacterium]|nr:sugar phosphate isomerase/epimerase [Clostridia bacterium]